MQRNVEQPGVLKVYNTDLTGKQQDAFIKFISSFLGLSLPQVSDYLIKRLHVSLRPYVRLHFMQLVVDAISCMLS